MSEPLISVIIPTYNRADVILKCLNALGGQTLACDRFEVLVCDDGSTDATADTLRGYRAPFPLKTLRQENAGPAAARNRCLRDVCAGLILILNDDAVASPDLLERHIRVHEELAGEKAAVLGSFPFPDDIMDSPFRWLLGNSNLLFQYPQMKPRSYYDYSCFWTCNLSLPRRAVEEAGLFDEDFKEPASEDLDYGYRLDRRGYRVFYDPSCRTEHHHRITVQGFCGRQVSVGRNAILLATKHPEITDRVTGLPGLPRGKKQVHKWLARWDNGALQALRGVMQLEEENRLDTICFPEIGRKMDTLLGPVNKYWIYLGFNEGFSRHLDPPRRPEGKPLRITFISPGLSISGGVKVILTYCNLLAARGHRVALAYLSGKRERWFTLHPRVKLISVKLRDKRMESKLPDADVVLATQWATAYPVARLSGRKGAKFYLVQDYESATIASPDECDPTYWLPLHRITVSSWLGELIHARFGGRTTSIPNGIDSDLLFPEPEKRMLHPMDDFRIGMLYHWEERKGVRDGVEAIRRVRQLLPNAKLVAMGASEPVDFPCDEFHNNITGDKVREFFNSLDVYMSTSWQEGFGLPGLEAMACGVPVVTTDSGGVREYAIPGKTALVVPPRNPQAMADALLRMADDAALRRSLAEEGLRGSKRFRWDAAVEAMERLFRESC